MDQKGPGEFIPVTRPCEHLQVSRLRYTVLEGTKEQKRKRELTNKRKSGGER